jgi:hypothetical protein
MIVQHSANREYDDDRKSHDTHGGSSSMHYSSYSSNVYSNLRGSNDGNSSSSNSNSNSNNNSGGNQQRDCVEEQQNCDDFNDEHLNAEISHFFKQIQERCHANCVENASNSDCQQPQQQQQQEHNHSKQHNIEKILVNHTKCKGLPCPIQRLKRKIQHFLFNSRKPCSLRRINDCNGKSNPNNGSGSSCSRNK